MKTLKEIVGLRIISVAGGTQVGHIKDCVLNPQDGTLDFFIVDQDNDYLGARIIAFADIIGLGEFALTIPGSDVIESVAKNPAAEQLLRLDVRVTGTKVLTRKGQLIGEVKEVSVNEENGKINSCLYEDVTGELREVPASQVITYGKELLIVDSEPLVAAEQSEPEEAAAVEREISAQTEPAGETDEGFNLFEQRQLQYFVGKQVDKDITLDSGDILFAGQPMTEETICKIKSRTTMMDITSHLVKA